MNAGRQLTDSRYKNLPGLWRRRHSHTLYNMLSNAYKGEAANSSWETLLDGKTGKKDFAVFALRQKSAISHFIVVFVALKIWEH